jgi:hypothetical protein
MMEVMETFETHIKYFKTRGQGQYLQSGDDEGLSFLSVTISGLKMEALVEIDMTHIFLIE